MTIIDVHNLTKKFKVTIKQGFWKDLFNPKKREVTAVNQISFKIDKGESVAFLGPNGAGKTTTTKMLTGLIYPTEGSISVLGYTPFDRKNDFLKRIGLVMGNKAGLNWDLTPSQSFELLRDIYEIPQEKFEERVEMLTELLDTKKYLDVQVRKLSLGERMKMELIGAILHDPEILFLDEPTIGLDIVSKQAIRKFLRKIQEESQITIILTSHDMDDIEDVCDRVIVITEGNKVYDDSMTTLMQSYSSEKYITIILRDDNQEIDYNDAEVIDRKKLSRTYRVPTEQLSNFLAEATKQLDIDDIDIMSTPLEAIIKDIFEKKDA